MTDATDFETTILPHVASLRARALRMCRDLSDAEDLVQDTLVRAWAYWDSYEARHGSGASETRAAGWVHTIQRNTFIDEYHRSGRRMRMLSEIESAMLDGHHPPMLGQAPPSTEDADRAMDLIPMADRLLEAVGAIPDCFRGAVELVDLQGCSYREAADTLGCPIGTVMSRLHRGRRMIGEQLGEGFAA